MIKLPSLIKQIPTWPPGELRERACPFCKKGGDLLFERADLLNIRKCDHCRALFISPAPSQNAIDRLYKSYYRDFRKNIQWQSPESANRIRASDPYLDFRNEAILSLMKKERGNALDIGFGRGNNLANLHKMGFNATGVDPDSDSVQFAKKMLLIPDVVEGGIEKLSAEKKFNLITLYDLIEHPLDPFALLQECVLRLKAGGLLAIFTPNATAAFKDTQPILFQIDFEHMQYLSAQTMALLASKLNLAIVHLEQRGFPCIPQEEGNNAGATLAIASYLKSIYRRLYAFPVVQKANRMRHALMAQNSIHDLGTYNLFCVFQNMG